jgi:hypothetical protein
VGARISKEPAAFIFRVEVTGMWMWLGCIYMGSCCLEPQGWGERDLCLGSVGIINKEL